MTAPTTAPTATAATTATLAAQQVYAAQQEALRQQLAAVILALWTGIAGGGDFSPAAAARFVEQLLPISIGAQRAMTALTVAQFNQRLSPPSPIFIAPDTTSGSALRGVDPSDYYARPFREVRWRLAQGKTLGEALDAGQRRAQSIAQTDLQLAHTHTARAYLDEAGKQPPGPRGPVVGFRRVLSSNPNHCALCILASTRIYNTGALMDIHPGCGCTVAEVHEGYDPGEELNERFAEDVHDIVRRDLGDKYVDPGGRKGLAAYRDIIITHQHGELGPVLGVRGQHFTGPAELRLAKTRVNPRDEPDDEPVTDLDAL